MSKITWTKNEENELAHVNSELTPIEFVLDRIYKFECLKGGGVCRMPLIELAQTYKFKNPDSLTRVRQSLHKKGWIIYDKASKTVTYAHKYPGKKTETESPDDAPKTDNKSVLPVQETDNKSVVTDNKSVLPVQETDNKSVVTDNKSVLPSGTKVVNKDLSLKRENRDLDLKERENKIPLTLTEAELLKLLPGNTPVEIHQFFYPDHDLTLSQAAIINSRITDINAWIKALYYWLSNSYLVTSIGKQCTKHDEIITQESKNEQLQPERTGNTSGSGYKSAGEKRTESAINGHKSIQQIRALNDARRRK